MPSRRELPTTLAGKKNINTLLSALLLNLLKQQKKKNFMFERCVCYGGGLCHSPHVMDEHMDRS